MNEVLERWNAAEVDDAMEVMLACCGARRWAAAMVDARPLRSDVALITEGERCWEMMKEPDWLEAFACHPRIGERKSAHAGARSAEWSRQEQGSVALAQEQTLAALAAANQSYEENFGFTYLVCATGKSADEMLDILNRRLANSREQELREAAEQQRQILQIRLEKWLNS